MITDELKVISETIEHAVTSPRRAHEAPVHFIMPWRLNTDVGHSLWEQGDAASCGSCPVD